MRVALYLRVGLLLVVALAIAVGLVLWLGGNRITEGRFYESYFRESVQGLDMGAPVKFRGVTVGEVRSIRLASAVYMPDLEMNLGSAASRLIVVTFVVDPRRVGKLPETKDAVAAGLRARVASAGLTGLSYIELDFVTASNFPPPPSYTWKPRYDVIPSVPSTITQVQDAGTTLLNKLNAFDLAGLQDRLFAVLDEMHATLHGGPAHQAMVNAATLLADIDSAVKQADLPQLSEAVRRAAASVNTLTQGPQTKESLAAAQAAMQKLGQAADKLPALIASLQDLVAHLDRSQADLAASLAPVLRNAQAAAANLRDLSDTLSRYPAGAVLGGPPPPPQESNK
jgi:ABC-type transporter Mla subunit MlaD